MSFLGGLIKKGLRMIPGVGTIMAGAEMIGDVSKAVKGVIKKPTLVPKKLVSGTGQKLLGYSGVGGVIKNLPALSGVSKGARVGQIAARTLNTLGNVGTTVYLGDMAINAVTHGKKTALQQGMPQTIDESMLRPYYRAPRGYVVVRDTQSGKYIGVRKADARQLGLWRPKPKPPISVRDWHAYKSAVRTEKKIKKVFSHSFRGSHHGASVCRSTRKRAKC
jgi:hypothetical protein